MPRRASRDPFVGRERELEQLMGILGRMLSGIGGAVLITGDIGLGKTRLAQEFEAMARGSGCITLQGACKSGAITPYLVFINALGPQAEPNDGPDVEQWDARLQEWSRIAVDTVRKAGRQDVPFKVLQLLRDLSKERPVLLRLDDLQYAKPECMQLFHFLARNLQHDKVLVLGLCRLEDLPPPVQGQAELANTLSIMRRERVVEEIELHPLGHKETYQLAKRLLGQRPDPRLCQKVHELTGGNPHAIVETIHGARDHEELRWNGERYDFEGHLTLRLSEEMRKVLLERLDDLDLEERRLMQMATVMGQEFSPELLGRAMGYSLMQTVNTLDEIVSTTHIIQAQDVDYRFHNVLQWRVVYDSLSDVERTEKQKKVTDIVL